MRTLLEYINKTHKSDYSDVSLYYNTDNRRVIGIKIHSRDHDFVLDTHDYNDVDFEVALAYQNHMIGGWRLGTKEEWECIAEHLDEINELLKQCDGDILSDKKEYWTGEKDPHEHYMAFVFNTYHEKVRLSSIYNNFTIRSIMSL